MAEGGGESCQASVQIKGEDEKAGGLHQVYALGLEGGDGVHEEGRVGGCRRRA